MVLLQSIIGATDRRRESA